MVSFLQTFALKLCIHLPFPHAYTWHKTSPSCTEFWHHETTWVHNLRKETSEVYEFQHKTVTNSFQGTTCNNWDWTFPHENVGQMTWNRPRSVHSACYQTCSHPKTYHSQPHPSTKRHNIIYVSNNTVIQKSLNFLEIQVLWDITPCGVVYSYWGFDHRATWILRYYFSPKRR